MFRIMLSLLLICLISFPAYSGLIEDIDDLSPEEAYFVMEKLQMKVLEGTPPEGVGGGMEIGVLNPSLRNLNNSLPAALKKFPVLVMWGGTWRWSFNERFQIGFYGAGGATTTANKSLIGDVEEATLGLGMFETVFSYKPIIDDNFEAYLDLGLDYLVSGFTRSSTPNGSSTTIHSWDGSTFGYRMGVGAKVRFNPIFAVGGDFSYLSAKINTLEEAGTVDATAPDIDLSGFFGKLGLQFHF